MRVPQNSWRYVKPIYDQEALSVGDSPEWGGDGDGVSGMDSSGWSANDDDEEDEDEEDADEERFAHAGDA
jgi:hypothetical protein